jgi:hypothetical protein
MQRQLPHIWSTSQSGLFLSARTSEGQLCGGKNPPPTLRVSAFPFDQSARMNAIPTIARVTSKALNLSFMGIFPSLFINRTPSSPKRWITAFAISLFPRSFSNACPFKHTTLPLAALVR